MVWQVYFRALSLEENPEDRLLASECLDGALYPFGVGAGGDDRDGDNEMSIVIEEMSKWAHIWFCFSALWLC